MDLISVIDDLKKEYEHAVHYMGSNHEGAHPVKSSDILEYYPNKTAKAYTNALYARLSDGSFGSKTIYVNEETGVTSGWCMAASKDGVVKASIESSWVTQIRCGLMAALCLNYRFGGEAISPRIAIVGKGKIASGVFSVIKNLGRITVVRKNGTAQHYNKFTGHWEEVILDKLVKFDVVISCTSEYEKENVIAADKFPDAKLFIAFDSGYYLGPEFRTAENIWSCADHPKQLTAHFHSEFPWDFRAISFSCLDTLAYRKPEKAVAYLYGLAMSDVYCTLHNEELRKLFSCETLS